MLSGDASVCRGDDRYGGQSPGFWKKLVGMTDPPYVVSCSDAWTAAGYDYGTLIPGKKNKYQNYEGGTRYTDVFGSNISDPGRSLREVLNEDNGSEQFHLIAGLLNARFFDNMSAGGNTQYIFTETQFWAMYDGNMDVPEAYSSLRDLISSNYHGKPGDDCGTFSSNDL